MSAENATTYGNVAGRHHQNLEARIHFSRLLCTSEDSRYWNVNNVILLQHSFVNRTPCRMECTTQLPTVSFINPCSLYCHQLILNNIYKIIIAQLGELSL